MGPEKIKLFEADIDIQGIISKSSQLKTELENLRDRQKELKTSGDTTSETYVKLEARLKNVATEYRINQQQVQNLTAASGAAITVQQKLDAALGKEIVTMTSAVKNNKELRKIRNDVNVTTEAGRKAVEDINKKIDENTAFIKENTDAYSQQKMQIGDYKGQIVEAYQELNIMNGGLGGFILRAQEAGGVMPLLKNGLSSVTSGLIGVTKASLAFIVTPIGAVIALIAGAFALVSSAMNRSEESANKLNKVFSVFSGVLDFILKALQPVGDFLIDGIVAGFEMAVDAAEKAITIISAGLKLLGFDAAAESVAEYGTAMIQAGRDAQKLAEMEAKLEKSQRSARLTQLQYQKDAESFRQIRDDENRSIAERIQANEDLGKVLEKQLEEELKIAKLALEVANFKIKQEGEKKELLDEQYEALTQIADIEERINSQRSEQLTNQVSLQKEAADAAKKAFEASLKRQELEIQLYIESQGIKAKTMEEELKIAEEVFQQRIELEKRKLAAGKSTQEEYNLFVLQNENELQERRVEIALSNYEREFEEFQKNNQRKVDEGKFFSDELLNQEVTRLNDLLTAEQEYWNRKLELGTINQQEYNDAIVKINEEHQAAIDEANLLREEAEKEKKAIDLENEREANFEKLEYDLEFRLQELEAKRLQEVEAAERTGADITAINEKYAKLRKDIETSVQDNKIALAEMALSNIAAIVGKESAIGKAVAIAQATIDTYKAAVAAYAAGMSVGGPVGLVLGPVSAALAVGAGMANIKKIASTKPPKAERGMAIDIGGRRHSSGGTKFYGEDGTAFEAEKGEKMFILNRQASAALAPLLSDINQQYGGVSLAKSSTYLAAGGQVLRSSMASQELDYERMGDMVREGVREGSLEGSRQGSLEGASRGTYSGMVDKQTNEIIENKSIFL